MKRKQGFTLMELMVVLLIIGILSTVALRTIDATRDRALFDQTTKKMNTLVQAIAGNPDLTFDGRRVDFGFYGDMERLPNDPHELLYSTGEPAWHGPYVKLTLGGDTASCFYDGWGNIFSYNSEQGTIGSTGNGKYTMSVNVADDLAQLSKNTIVGTITDRDGAAPGTQSLTLFRVVLYYNNASVHPAPASVVPDPSGYYEISSATATPQEVPIGIKRLVAYAATESLVRYVTIIPRSKTVVDFKFSGSFWNKLRVVGTPTLTPDSSGFLIKVENGQTTDVTVSWLTFFDTPANMWMRNFYFGSDHVNYPLPDGTPGTGRGDTINFTSSITLAPGDLVDVAFLSFYDTQNYPPGNPVNVHGKTFNFRLSDGSELTVNP
jgi:prepilin-type N-terminal cleavage/methylation domain-containing protein